MDTGALTAVGGRRAGARAPACGRSSPRSAALLVVVGLVTYPVVFIFGIILLIAATAEWMVQAWSERASADVGLQRRRPRPHRPPAGVPDPRRRRRRHHHLLVQPDHAVPVQDQRPGRLRRHRRGDPRRRRSSSPSARRCARAPSPPSPCVAALGLVTGGVAAALGGERELHPHETTGALAADGGCATDEETEADEHDSQTSPPRPTSPPELTLTEDGTLVAKNLGVTGDQDTVVVTRANPTNVVFHNESDEERRLVLDLGTRPELDADGNEIPDTEVPDQHCTALVEEGGSQFLTFYDPGRQRGRRHRRTRSSSPASTVPASRWRCRERRAEAVDRGGARLASGPCLVPPGAAGAPPRSPPPRPRPRPPGRLRQGRPAGHLAAGRRERPEDPEPAVAGLPHRRRRDAARVRRRRLGRLPLPRPRPADPRADARQAGARDRADDPAGADPHRRRHPDRRHADGAGQDRRHRVLRQRHRPAVVVGDRLPGPGGLRRDRPSRSSPAARWSSRPAPTCSSGAPAATSSTAGGSPGSTASATWCPAGCRPCACEADQPGIYAGQCTEFCGLSHANMRMEVVALDAADFETWKANQLADVRAAGGRHAGRHRRADVHRPVLALPPGQRAARQPTATR